MSYHLVVNVSPPSRLDPILPLPAGTGIPPVTQQGYGKKLFKDQHFVAAGMTYRSFYVMWEQVELRAAQNYPRYVDSGPMSNVAEAWLEAVVWCRQIAHPNVQIEPMSEKKAKRIRAKELQAVKDAKKQATADRKNAKNGTEEKFDPETSPCPKCGPNRLFKKVRKDDLPFWKCCDCGHRIPRSEVAASAPDSAREPRKTKKRSQIPEKGAKTPTKRKKKVKK